MPTAAGPRRLFTVRRVVSSVLLTAAFVGMAIAFMMHDDTPLATPRPQAVRTVSPTPNTLQLRQTEIFVELDPSYIVTTFLVNDTAVPDDQLVVIRGLNRYSFTPGTGRELKALPPGRTCVGISYALAVGGGEPGSFQWCFNVS